jgi:hypothetical protein
MAYGTMPRGGTAPTASGYEPAYGGIPQLPKYTTDSTSMTGTDVQANLVKNLPNYMGMVGADVGNISQNLAGALPPDVIQQIQQQAAERGIQTGSPGSANTSAEYLRALGLTSLQLQQLGHSQLTEAMQRTPVQQTQAGTSTQDLSAQQAIYNAAPVPGAAARQAMLNAQQGMNQGRSLAGGVPVVGGGGTGGYGAASAGAGWDSRPVPSYPNIPTAYGPGGGQDLINSISPIMSPAAYSSGMAYGVPTGTGYNAGANTNQNLYGQPQYYGQASQLQPMSYGNIQPYSEIDPYAYPGSMSDAELDYYDLGD